MTLSEMLSQIRDMGAQCRAAAAKLAQMAGDSSVSMDDVNKQQAALNDLTKRQAAMQAAYDARCGEEGAALPAQDQQGEKDLHALRASREYARAFSAALRGGITPQRGVGNEQLRPLYDALTIAGGSPAGEDGGFLVPEDVDNQVRELRREMAPLSDLFTVETVTTNSGWRVMDAAPEKGLTALTGEVPDAIAADDQPAFVKVPFTLKTYGLILPVSNELAADEQGNLFAYLARWFAKKQVITENLLIKAMLKKLVSVNIPKTEDAVGAIKSALNKALDPEISVNAAILTNQDGFDYLDQLKAVDGRPLLMPDPTNATVRRLAGRVVRVASNKTLPSTKKSGDLFPLYIGDFKQYGTLFMRQGLEVRSTDVGGNAFRTNSIEVRGITRLGSAVFDSAAAVRRDLFIAT